MRKQVARVLKPAETSHPTGPHCSTDMGPAPPPGRTLRISEAMRGARYFNAWDMSKVGREIATVSTHLNILLSRSPAACRVRNFEACDTSSKYRQSSNRRLGGNFL